MKANPKLRPLLLAPLALIGALLGSASATTIFSDNFESYTVGATLPTGGNWDQATSGQTTVRDETTATPFGTSNRYVDYNDNSTNTAGFRSKTIAAASNVLTTLSLDFYEPDVSGRNDAVKIGYSIDGADMTSANTRVSITLDDGVIGGTTGGTGTSYSYATAYRLFMAFNDSASSVSYTGGGTITSGSAHVWFQNLSTNALTFAGVANAANTGTAESSYAVGIRANSGSHLQQVFFDNASLDTGLVVPGLTIIPEPSAAFLAGLGTLLLLRRRRAA